VLRSLGSSAVTRRTPRTHRAAVLSTIVVVTAVLAGCALGPRPTLTDERRVDDSAIEAVLDRLDGAGATSFTATYAITPTLADAVPAEVTVTHSPASSHVVVASGGAVTVEYVTTDGEQRTCAAGQSDCVAGLDETRISNLAVSSSFWGPSSAQKLRTDATRNVADATASTEILAGETATCAAVPIGPTGIPTVYCAVDGGPLAAYRGADVTIELISYTP